MAKIPAKPPIGKVTPLWIVAAFLTLTEVTLSIALIHVSGGVQVALAVFVILFALLVAASFFYILWHRPYVFYSPSEYGNIDPSQFMSALRNSPQIKNQIELAKSIEENPLNMESKFTLIDAMLDEVQSQFIICMHEFKKDIPKFSKYVYEFQDGGAGVGQFGGTGRAKLDGTGLAKSSGNDRFYSITEQGHEFAMWLIKKGRKADYFWCNQGSWGNPKLGGSAEKWRKESDVETTGTGG